MLISIIAFSLHEICSFCDSLCYFMVIQQRTRYQPLTSFTSTVKSAKLGLTERQMIFSESSLHGKTFLMIAPLTVSSTYVHPHSMKAFSFIFCTITLQPLGNSGDMLSPVTGIAIVMFSIGDIIISQSCFDI